MNLNPFFKSIIQQDCAPIVICDTNHTIIYMNPTAIERYSKRGGASLIGSSLLNCHNERSVEAIKKTVEWFRADKSHNILFTFHNEKENKDVYMVALRGDEGELIGYYEKHEKRTPETAKTYDM